MNAVVGCVPNAPHIPLPRRMLRRAVFLLRQLPRAKRRERSERSRRVRSQRTTHPSPEPDVGAELSFCSANSLALSGESAVNAVVGCVPNAPHTPLPRRMLAQSCLFAPPTPSRRLRLRPCHCACPARSASAFLAPGQSRLLPCNASALLAPGQSRLLPCNASAFLAPGQSRLLPCNASAFLAQELPPSLQSPLFQK